MTTESTGQAQGPNSTSASTIVLLSPDEHIRLAPPTSAEDEQVAVLRSDPKTRRFLRFWPESISVQEVAERRETRLKDPKILDFNVFDDSPQGGGKFIGISLAFNIDDTHRSCEAGIAIISEAAGKGLSTVIFYTLLKYVFEERGMHLVTFHTAEDNAPMRGWLEKVAEARLEATQVDWWADGQGGWTTVKGYAILDHEWKGKVKSNLKKRMAIAGTASP
ncbi:acyl-CoA N-acyltransferase [Coprinopsis sp. MPI-PUGE-AT-0042]|nr:acyl-CoA N-acyltransferase [Coprinopsis sp. MPI-PUGE-AT-0042]